MELQLFVNKSAPVPHVVRIFPLKSDRSSNGICEFETTERSVEALALANHATVGPSGNLYAAHLLLTDLIVLRAFRKMLVNQ